MKKKLTPYLLLVPQLLLGVVFLIGLGTGITQSLGVIPAFGLTEPTLKYYKEVLTRPDLLQSLKYSLYIAFMSAFLATVTGTFLCAVLVSAGKVRGIIMRIVQIPIIGKYKRRMTVREAARLQSFPNKFIPDADDHQAYKQFGNAVNVDVIEQAARKLFEIK